jgi:hypothetical protein
MIHAGSTNTIFSMKKWPSACCTKRGIHHPKEIICEAEECVFGIHITKLNVLEGKCNFKKDGDYIKYISS